MLRGLLFPFIIISFFAYGQAGEWTWVNGYNTLNGMGVFGTQGVPNAANKPPALWSAFYWTDSQGNFWLFGGLRNGSEYSALWKYDPQLNTWTWMKGPSTTSQSGVYGTKGVSSVNNYPGARAWGSCSWIDSNDNLWLFGGQGRDYNGDYGLLGDVWKYSIATNEWTWVAGSNNTYPPTVHGTLQVADPANTPGGRVSTRACWIDGSNNLWLFGGEGILVGTQFSDVWKFDPSTSEWTWMKGPATTNENRLTGPVGSFTNNYTPGGRSAYATWKDSFGRFWLFGGNRGYSDYYADMWAFDPGSLQWAYMGGTTDINSNGDAGNLCESSTTFYPGNRYQNTACWTDPYGRFWQFGGFNISGSAQDLWCFDPLTLKWTWTSGSLTGNTSATYGTMGMSAPANIPYSSGGAASWCDQSANLWMYGGFTYIGANGLGDLWKFTPDLNCPEVQILPIELTDFTVTNDLSNTVLLSWSTASEINNATYTVQRSANAIDFTNLGDVAGTGTTMIMHKYSFTDYSPHGGINYYRLRQKDDNGKFSYSAVKSIVLDDEHEEKFYLQNPATNPVTVYLQLDNALLKSPINLRVIDIFGKQIAVINCPPNEQLILPYLYPGLYLIEVKTTGYFESRKLVIN
jgi:hypothetical protein